MAHWISPNSEEWIQTWHICFCCFQLLVKSWWILMNPCCQLPQVPFQPCQAELPKACWPSFHTRATNFVGKQSAWRGASQRAAVRTVWEPAYDWLKNKSYRLLFIEAPHPVGCSTRMPLYKGYGQHCRTVFTSSKGSPPKPGRNWWSWWSPWVSDTKSV